MNNRTIFTGACLLIAASVQGALGGEIHVSKKGKDSNAGTIEAPVVSISKAVELAQAGDTVWVHAGIYRESVNPVRGGAGEDQRIAFRAVPDEEVFVKGSEQITTWTQQQTGVWKAELPNEFFGEYNPYAIKIAGSCMDYGGWHHCGDVYLNGEAFYEARTLADLKENEKRWFGQVNETTTTIWANFGTADPNTERTEINARETLFWPAFTGLRYITIDGFHFEHAAANWAGHFEDPQIAAVGPEMGKCWIIENCTVTHARAVGIGLGQSPNTPVTDIHAFGDHIIRNNIIRNCGQSGISGKRGATRCEIYGNLIEDTNYRREFGGDETASIKLMRSVDTILRDNLIRGCYSEGTKAAFGIWIDYTTQGMRISRNIIYGTETQALFLEMNHGPILVDNNIIIGPSGLSNLSESSVFAHNLFMDCSFHFSTDPRQSSFYTPHTTIQHEKMPIVLQDDKFYNNIFIQSGLHAIKPGPGYEADCNAYMQGAKKSSFEGKNSLVDDFDMNFRKKDAPLGVDISFLANDAMVALDVPLVNDEFVGVFTVSQQTIEDRYGNPIAVDHDMNGQLFSPVKVGPLADLKAGKNTVHWSYSKDRKYK